MTLTHITIVVVSRHAESSIGPANQLHRRRVRNQVLQISAALVQQTLFEKLFLVVFIKNFFHGGPESLLPFEHRLFGDNIRRNTGFQAPTEEQMSQTGDIVVGIVIYYHDIVIIGQIAFIYDKGWRSFFFGQVGRQQGSFTDLIPTRTVFAPDRMSFKEHRVLVPQFNPINMNGITTNGNSIPSPSHGSIGGPPRFLQAHLFDLKSRRRNGRFFENGTNVFSGLDGILYQSTVETIFAP